MRTIAVINQKGGCGKTTTSINLAAGLARRGFRTLLVDLDPQSHCAAGLGVPEDRIDLDVSDALRSPADQSLDRERLLWRVGRGFDLLPSRMKLAGLEAARGGLADMDQPQGRLNGVLDRLTRAAAPDDADAPAGAVGDPERRYDAVVIDCPPSIGLLSYNALAAASEVLIPVETSYFSLRGAGKQIQTARSVARHMGVEPRVRLLATMFDPSLPLARDLLDDLRDRFGAAVVPLAIRADPEVKEAASFGRPIEEHAPESMGANDYASLCEWVIERAGLDRPEPGTDSEGVDRPRLPDQTLEARPLPGTPIQRTIPSAEPKPAPVPDAGGEPMSRAREIALRTASMPRETKPAAQAQPQSDRQPDFRAETRAESPVRTQPAPRSVLPPKPVAIELSTEPALDPNRHPAAPPLTKEPNAEALRHLWGVCSVEGGLFFVQPATGVRSVAVVGDFNGWDPSAGEMTKRSDLGIFECRIECPPGRFHYRLVIDGEWRCDAYNPARVPNGLGGENNLAVV